MMIYQLGEGKWRIKAAGGDEWFPSKVPGEVHLALLDAGRIPDPFVADNELNVAWVSETDWVFEGVIQVPDELLDEDGQVQLSPT